MIQTLTKPVAEKTVLLKNVTWETFNSLLTELGDQRSQRLSYYLGNLEIMSPLGEHENDNRFVDDLIRVIADELNLNLKKLGSLTLKSDQHKRAVEPDSCYYLQNEPSVRNKQNIDLTIDPPPDLALEIDITNSSIDKLPIYTSLKVPEVWLYDGKKLRVFRLEENNNNYQALNQSPTFPWLNLAIIPELINRSLEEGETKTLKYFRQWIQDNVD